jgi:hypothetical protein
METLTLEQVKQLSQVSQYPCISIFMPTHRAGPDIQQDPIRFKNLLREAEQWLLDSGMGAREAGKFLEPAQALLDDGYFWRHQWDGLAMYIAQADFHTYRLPFSVEESLIVAGAYYVKPILPLFTNNGHYYLLAFSQNDVRLFEGTRYTIGQIDLPEGTPQSLDDTFQSDDPEKQLQFHTGTIQGGIRSAVYHGHGAGDEEQKERIERSLNLVDAALKEILREQQAPLVLAGVDYLLPIYRKVSEYATIMEEGITGNPEELTPQELQKAAWPIVEDYFRRDMQNVIAQFRQLAGTGLATEGIEEIVAAAHRGRVDKLILPTDVQVWGTFDPETSKVVHHQDGQRQDNDLALLDFAAMQTLRNGGKVYALPSEEMPTTSSVLAVFRY